MSLNILITGASGFLGMELCKILSLSPHKVTALDIRKPHEKYENINYEEISIDLFLKNNKQTISNYNLIVHAAAVLPYKSSKDALIATNVNTTLNLIKHISILKNTFFVYISSSSVYGNPNNVPISENTIFNPLDLYAETKIISEENIKKYLKKDTYAIIRPTAILGKNRKGIFEIFFKLIKYNIPIPVPNRGKQKIQFVEIEDVARLIIHIGQNNLNGEWPAGAPNPKPLIDHLKLLGKKIGKNIIVFNLNERIFYFVGILLIKLKLINFTKYHFGSFPKSFYFDETWVPKEFNYLHSSEDAFINSSKTFFDI